MCIQGVIRLSEEELRTLEDVVGFDIYDEGKLEVDNDDLESAIRILIENYMDN